MVMDFAHSVHFVRLVRPSVHKQQVLCLGQIGDMILETSAKSVDLEALQLTRHGNQGS